jgi:7,8-dihydroneopterin aldolase/epimerase/oxygenase
LKSGVSSVILPSLPWLDRRSPSMSASSYRIVVRGLVLPFRIGVYEHEKLQPQRVRVSVELVVEAPARTDALNQVLNYETIIEGIRALAQRGHIPLVEALAEQVLALCFSDRRVRAVRVGVDKLDVCPEAESVGVIMTRRRGHPADPG